MSHEVTQTVRGLSKPLITLDNSALEASLRSHIAEPDFPCVGAKSALAKGTLRVISGWSLTSAWDDLKIHEALMDWSEEFRKDPAGLRSLAVVFEGPTDVSESDFERLMWERIQSLADKDDWLGQPYDPKVSTNPEDPHFSLSFGGQAYFVVGLHPNASRPARRTPHPTLVFNLHEQFETLRNQNRYERMRERIIERDVALSGSANPMLARHGEMSEARQYSGREVEGDWQCPFSDPRGS
ncbi:guanitoxin biosynthesis heme-dependent pre-guanitoxin N-hydroxylase GntA [Allopontixanthobacter sediminis]|uniref:YqcI/YcgG family protein n=1 Tax=Allopontixanthobacter sediminis TaxID=1689985 RepID=A0A845AYX9_9SPHN|nr:guanitoxin biosynthesis heme-dependent pre-guanitoxin N-hydroxylase GntA [Allopontixanthobacter sediminis]MXP43074.1 YqcI/YcgG family protein [Allopontixanthobacter sediminis]